ncbi:MAG: DUF1015 domain-containing protein [Opitutales bacterium]|nr:DUF1015 domain-containing protein [Opitutales bacterium]
MDRENIGLNVPNILLPRKEVDLSKWAVVACDQYTSQPKYWAEVESLVKGCPSTLNAVFPEVFLEDEDGDERIGRINAAMEIYLDEGVLEEQGFGFILLDRKTSHAESRKGIVVALDLEKYDYKVGSESLIRATEGTIEDRLPPRVKIRENAKIELPHIMVLIDDPERTVIEPLFEKELDSLYDFELMADGGHLKGWRVDSEQDIDAVFDSLSALGKQNVFDAKYGVSDKGVLLFAMGDGNHSLATAKNIWEDLKSKSGDLASVMDHPARYALVELMNVHDEGLEFEPIHRVIFDIDADNLKAELNQFFEAEDSSVVFERFDSLDSAKERLAALGDVDGEHLVMFVTEAEYGIIRLSKPSRNLEVGNLQAFINSYLEGKDSIVDYIHGEDVVVDLGSKPGNIGFFLPVIGKSAFFKTVVLDGALPRKTFSMGEAEEKRFYLEARRIQ